MFDALAAGSAQAIDVGGAFDDAFRSVVNFLPKLIAFLIILLIGWLIARVLRTLVNKGLEKVNFDRAVQRGGLSAATTRVDASDLIARVVYYAILLIALQLAFGVFGPNPVSDLLNRIVAWLPSLIVAIIIVVVVAAIASAVRDVITRALSGVSYGPFLGKMAAWLILALGAIAALNQIGVATTVTLPILITVLAIIAGVTIVGVGGGLVRPMQQRWEGWLDRAERDIPTATARREAYQRGREDAARVDQPTEAMPSPAAARQAPYASQPTPQAPRHGLDEPYESPRGGTRGQAGPGAMPPPDTSQP
jgi:preprotein translocase subunit SecG